ncbi:unnamed protein product [Protopolystoma xenopodis]|uniref:Diphthine--ammonia ligase n=1 Tax=Protopolystoma xenopodis TaxID=117903 RepID=A0A3S5B600_9PLAT|nr:unnamed protein product [Protopolystoma xenopodis]
MEMDSHMFQCVGNECIKAIAKALDLPLYKRELSGSAICKGFDYYSSDLDEVEDLFRLIQSLLSSDPEIKGVAVGAILSNYQRIRVEHVCARLNMISLAFLWQRDQLELLDCMIASNLDAIIIKIASFGLSVNRDLGQHISKAFSNLRKLASSSVPLNACGEGGEYESITLDCPIFKKQIVLQPKHIKCVVSSSDPFAPVAHLQILHFDLLVSYVSCCCICILSIFCHNLASIFSP